MKAYLSLMGEIASRYTGNVLKEMKKITRLTGNILEMTGITTAVSRIEVEQ